MRTLTPTIWFAGDAVDGAALYARVLPETTVTRTDRYPTEGLLPFQEPLAGKELTIHLEGPGCDLVLINAGPEFRPTPASSFTVTFGAADDTDAVAALDAAAAALAEGGRVLMPLQQYPFSDRYTWVEDRFGVSWQLTVAFPTIRDEPSIVPTLLFGGQAQNRAAEAIAQWTALLPDSRVVRTVPFTDSTGPASRDALMFAEVRLAGQRVYVMDAGSVQDTTFTPAVSYQLACRDQAEIDRVWAVLSTVPEAEQCGWCTDQFGVSWQIIPAHMDELMARPHAFEHMLEMTKLVIDGF
ncbi:VOC family protein [Sanguibacter sp. A247]|uniref:VOC family protein n=1 Tax=unclassified Sanguibacter TaxID=2645534 RepID=UPI003FD8A90F